MGHDIFTWNKMNPTIFSMQITKLQTKNGQANQIFDENSIFIPRSLVDFADNQKNK